MGSTEKDKTTIFTRVHLPNCRDVARLHMPAQSETWLVPLPLAGLLQTWRAKTPTAPTFTYPNYGESKVQKGDHGQGRRWEGRWS